MSETEPLLCRNAEEWEAWLEANHETSNGVFLLIAKKGSEHQTVGYPDVLDLALCFGWIDAIRKSYDADFFLQRYTPRRPKSRWSQINVEKVEAMIAKGKMRPRGLDEMEKAKADGRWAAAYAPASKTVVPEDLKAALDANPAAAEFFASLDRTNWFAVIFRVESAKRPETRAKRIQQFVEMLARGETIYPVPPGRKKATAETAN